MVGNHQQVITSLANDIPKEALAPRPPPALGLMDVSYSLDSLKDCSRLRNRGVTDTSKLASDMMTFGDVVVM